MPSTQASQCATGAQEIPKVMGPHTCRKGAHWNLGKSSAQEMHCSQAEVLLQGNAKKGRHVLRFALMKRSMTKTVPHMHRTCTAHVPC